ncbi:hypothetical protein E1J38_012055 [Seonamhaeicola sediminis]|uniref:GP-PDE domain-containing protein n=1 Tax=Seonamhaeicola sediminis TaxID=2528206 RepID=A0A562YBQ0_9FLAO|nr:glycerophosphodiester phosphodiesterase family protein [Seonamhaeicola sediminis]TWO31804.1 hypothetical protein E1J38_012055 [Seonamhaeicola sediminis]
MGTNLNKEINVQGHRGCRGLMPENTIEAFEKAIDLGVHTLEMDVVISKDKIVVVSHEPFMSKTYCLNLEGNQIREIMDKQYNLYKMTFDSLQLFDCGSKKHPRLPEQKNFKTHKPALGDVLKKAMFRNPIIKFNIELKARPKWDNKYTPEPKEFVALVLKVIEENAVFNQTNLQSFICVF